MYAAAPLDSSTPSALKNSMRVDATRDQSRSTSARNSKCALTAGLR